MTTENRVPIQADLDEAFVRAYAETQFPKARPEDREHMLEAARWHIKIGDLSVAPARRLFDAGVAAGRGEPS